MLVQFSLASVLLVIAKTFAQAIPMIMALTGDAAEQADHERYSYIAPRDLGSEPFYPDELGVI